MITTDDISGVLSSRGNVIGSDGEKIGSVEQIFLEDATGEPAWATVKTGLFGMSQSFVPLAGASTSGNDIRVNYSKEQVKDAPRIDDSDGRISPQEEDELYRYYDMSGTDTYTDRDVTTDRDTYTDRDVTTDRDTYVDTNVDTNRGTDDAMTRSEERLHVGTESREVGRVRLRKYIVTENVTRTVPVSREEVRLEREPITDANVGDAVSGPELTESEHEVTLHAEEPIVAKETVPVERVRLDKDTVTEQVNVNEQVRKEEVEVDDDGRGTRR
jgi:uncharacterized protein (TIGR02271 family)